MKKVILLCIFISGLGQLNAQITLNRSDYTAQLNTSFDVVIHANFVIVIVIGLFLGLEPLGFE